MSEEIGFETDQATVVKIALSMYIGERCKFCGKEYKTLEDLQDTVYVGDHEHGRLACASCWNQQKEEAS